MKPSAGQIFAISNEASFEEAALAVFRYQAEKNPVYRSFLEGLRIEPGAVVHSTQIPYLPVSFFKTHIVSCRAEHEVVFSSSGTTGTTTSRHYVADAAIYRESFMRSFRLHYGAPSEYCIMALLPSYLERSGSSLVYMSDHLIRESNHPFSGFYLHDLEELAARLKKNEEQGQKTLLLGVSFALLDLVETHSFSLRHTTVMETGGMKGRRREMIREELHDILKTGFGLDKIHSEYGMTEMLSQAYSAGDGIFTCPPWLRISIRDTNDALSPAGDGKTGGVNVMDLANLDSCAFVATQDLGKMNARGFEILGRYDNSDIRGCNLLAL